MLNLFPRGRHFANSSALQFSVLPLSPWAFYLDFPKCTRRAHSITLGGTMASSKTQTYAAFLYLKFSLEELGAPLLKVFCLWKHCLHERWRKMACHNGTTKHMLESTVWVNFSYLNHRAFPNISVSLSETTNQVFPWLYPIQTAALNTHKKYLLQ